MAFFAPISRFVSETIQNMTIRCNGRQIWTHLQSVEWCLSNVLE